MIESADLSQPPARRGGHVHGFSGTVRDELARVRGKGLGACAACGQPVFADQNFTRSNGRTVHLRCPISARTESAIIAAGSRTL